LEESFKREIKRETKREMSYSLLPEEVMMEGRISIMNGK
jgi:hypothetical protein